MKRENEGVEEQLSTKVNHYVVMYMCHQQKDHDKTFPTMMWKVAFWHGMTPHVWSEGRWHHTRQLLLILKLDLDLSKEQIAL